MSFHGHDGDDDRRSPAPPLDWLDEYWFFSNTLDKNKNKQKAGGTGSSNKKLPPKSPSTSTAKPQKPSLLRSPSLPPPRMPPSHDQEEEPPVKKEQEEEAGEVDDDDLNWSSIYEGVLRTRITAAAGGQQQGRSSNSSSLRRAPSMPVPSSSSDHHHHHHVHGRGKEKAETTPSSSNSNKLRHSYSTLERHCHRSGSDYIKQQQAEQKHTTARSSSSSSSKQQKPNKPMTMMVRSKSALFDTTKKNWKSSSDLESLEVQGFKDLGFVFDKEELREDLADVLPGLKNAAADDDHGSAGSSRRRPYLSEVWHQHHDHRPPALIRVQSEARSAAEMKDQLRMWAQAVACNVRQECV